MHSRNHRTRVRGLLLGSVLPGSMEETHGFGYEPAEHLHGERFSGPILNSRLANMLVRAGVPNGDVPKRMRHRVAPCAVSAAPARHLDLAGRHTGPGWRSNAHGSSAIREWRYSLGFGVLGSPNCRDSQLPP